MPTYNLADYANGAAVAAALDLAGSSIQPSDLAVATGEEGAAAGLISADDQAKLNGIEAGATADQTAQEIATLIDADATAEGTLISALDIVAPSNTFWDDLDFALAIRINPAENPPVWSQISDTGVYAWAFQDGDIAHFQRQIPHKFKTSQTGWKPHVHWMPTSSAQYTGTWSLTLTGHVTNPDPSQAPLITTITRTGSFNVAATAWQGHLTPLNDGTPGKAIDGTGWGISTILFAKLVLTLSAGSSCVLSGFDMHGEIDAAGSDEEYIK